DQTDREGTVSEASFGRRRDVQGDLGADIIPRFATAQEGERLASNATVTDLFTWQIGSERPPNVCLCCGLAFDEGERKIHGPYRTGPYIWVCEACWNLPFLFF